MIFDVHFGSSKQFRTLNDHSKTSRSRRPDRMAAPTFAVNGSMQTKASGGQCADHDYEDVCSEHTHVDDCSFGNVRPSPDIKSEFTGSRACLIK